MDEKEIIHQDQLDKRFIIERELANEKWKSHHNEHTLASIALNKAEDSMNLRLEGMNELRAQLNNQQNTFVTKEMLIPFQSFMDKFSGVMIAFTVGNIIITLIISLVVKIWHVR